MGTKVTISVILPNYNYANYLEKRIEGILNQTFHDIELILLDDKSTDNSANILRQYESHPKVSALIINSENSGSPFLQWEKGISLAKGKYIWIAEADDEAQPGFLSACIEALEATPNASVCYVSSAHIDPEGNDNIPRHKPTRTNGYSIYDGMTFARRNLYWRNYIENASGAVFRRDAYERIQDKTWKLMRSSGDWLFWFQMAMQGDVIRVHNTLNRFRIHPTSVTASARSRSRTYIEEGMIISAMEQSFRPPISRYIHCIRVGQLYRFVRKYVAPEEKKHTIAVITDMLHTPYWVRHFEAFNRLMRWLPFTANMKREALPDTYSY